jgi:hypothetical protein
MFRIDYTAAAALSMFLASGLAATAEPILTVELPNHTRTFTLQDLAALENVTFTTTTVWTEGDQTFTGVPLNELVNELGLVDGVIQAVAINDYSVSIPVEEALAEGPVVAYLLNGQPMSVRDKGPLWIVYPYSSNPEYQTEVAYSRSIWQLDRLLVEG